MDVKLITLSSKGQVILPAEIRKRLALDTGTRFAVFTDGDCILLKPVEIPRSDDFRNIMRKAQEWAAHEGVAQAEVNSMIKEFRSEKRKQRENRN